MARKRKYALGGALLTTGISMIGGAIQNQRNRRLEQEKAEQEQLLNRQQVAADELSFNPIPNYTPTFQKGGNMRRQTQSPMSPMQPGQDQFIDYKNGQTHGGPDGGIPVDERGQPAETSGAPEVALTEKGEVTFNGFVFSNDIKLPGNKKRTFADEAKRIKNKHKLHLGEDLERTDKIAYNAFLRELKQLRDIQEAAKGEMIHQDEAAQMAEEAMMAGAEQGAMGAEQGMAPPAGGPPIEPGTQEQQMPMMSEGGRIKMQRPDNYYQQPHTENLTNFAAGSPSQESTTAPTPSNWGEAQAQVPWANMAAAAITPLIGLATDKPTPPVRLSRTRMPRANLAPVRAGIREQGRLASSTARRVGQRAGTTAAQQLAGAGATEAGIRRNMGNALREAAMTEQQMNMQAIGQENQMNMQTAHQEQMMNWQTQQMDRQRRDSLRAGLTRIPQQGLADYQKQRDTLAALNMQGPMQVQQYNDPNQSRLSRMFGGRRTRIGVNPRYNPELHQ